MQELVFYLIKPLIPVLSLAVVVAASGSNLLYVGGGYSDPFTPYEAMMPEQLVTTQGQLCEPQIVPGYVDTISCEVDPIDGHFNLVIANISNGRFVHIAFSANNLYIGDIVRRWGRPDKVVKDYLHYYLLWDNGLRIVIDPVGVVGRFDYLNRVERVLVFREPAAWSG